MNASFKLKIAIAVIYLLTGFTAGAYADELRPSQLNFTNVLRSNTSNASVVLTSHFAGSPTQQNQAIGSKPGWMLLQDAEIAVGKAKIRLGYQNIDQDFNGFSALTASSNVSQDALKQLEKERGLKRLNVQTDINVAKNATVSAGLQMVKDGKDSIVQQSFAATSGKLKASFNIRNIGTDFSRFGDIREADRDQLAKEKGMKRTNLALQYGQGSGISLGTITASQGKLSTKALDYIGKNLGVSIYKRSVDPKFNRLADLSQEDRTGMALAVRKQFNPNATADQVTDADRAAVANEAGIERTNIRSNFKAGSINTSVQVLNIAEGQGGIKRNSIGFSGKNYSVGWTRQSIGEGFSRLSQLAPVEQGEFANERGMERTALTGQVKLGSTNVAMSFSKVSDKEGSATKQSISLTGKKYDVSAKLQNIDPTFKRSMDLADPDKKQMAQDQGYKKTELSANLRPTKSLSFENSYMRAQNVTDDKNKSQLTNRITFAPNPGTKITFFRDQYSSGSSKGNISSYVHQAFTLDQQIGAFRFSGLRDTNTVEEGEGKGRTTSITALHLESNQKARNSFTFDQKTVDSGNGQRESTRSISIASKPTGNVSLRANMQDVQRSTGSNESTRNVNMEWNVNKNIKAAADVTSRNSTASGPSSSTNYSVAGKLPGSALGVKDINFSARMSKETANGQVKKEDDRININARTLGGEITLDMNSGRTPEGKQTGKHGFRYVSNRDPKKRIHFDLGYAKLETGSLVPTTSRSLNVDVRLGHSTTISYSYFANLEKPDGKIDTTGGRVIKLSTVLGKRFNLAAEYGTTEDYACGSQGLKMGLGITGKLSNGASVEIYFGMTDLDGVSAKNTNRIYRFSYDHKVNADNYLSLSGTMKTYNDHNPATHDNRELETRIDFRRVFH